MLLRLLAIAILAPCVSATAAESTPDVDPSTPEAEEAALSEPRVIGATAWVTEKSSEAQMLARVDTGAESCSLHVEEIDVPDGDKKMRANVGKKIRFRILGADGKSHWVDSKIASTVIVKNAERRERRYKVWVDLLCQGVEKRVCVTLNDRSDMDFPMLVGRNFLKGSFVVDVAIDAKQERTKNKSS